MKLYKYTEEELREAVSGTFSVRQALIKLGVAPWGGNYAVFKNAVKHFQLDTSHFRGKGWNVGGAFRPIPPRTLEEILVLDAPYKIRSSRLRERLIEEGYFPHQCVSCELTEWLNQPMPLELDHINGNREDNRLENLRLLCPNCHAFTPTYRRAKSSLQA